MRKSLSTRAFAVSIAVASFLTANPLGTALAAPDHTTGVELGPAHSLIPVTISAELSHGRDVGIPALQQLRARMWDENPLFTTEKANPAGTRLRDIAHQLGVSRDEYLNIRSDAGLVHIALQRAAENSDHPAITHTRPNGLKSFTATRGKQSMTGESLAAGIHALPYAILHGWGSEEIPSLNAAHGVFNRENGHLHMLINPKNRAIGFAHVDAPRHPYKWISVAITAGAVEFPDDLPKGHRPFTIHRAAGNYEPAR